MHVLDIVIELVIVGAIVLIRRVLRYYRKEK
jgi:uncharacterized membrane protein